MSSSSSGGSLQETVPLIWSASSELLIQASVCTESLKVVRDQEAAFPQLQHVPSVLGMTHPWYRHPEAALAALQHGLDVLGTIAAIWQWCYGSSSSRAFWGMRLDQFLVAKHSDVAFMIVPHLLDLLLSPKLLQPLCSNHYSALMGIVPVALQVQVGHSCTVLHLCIDYCSSNALLLAAVCWPC